VRQRVREIKRARESVCACVCVRERGSACVREKGQEEGGGGISARHSRPLNMNCSGKECMSETESVRARKRERERERERESARARERERESESERGRVRERMEASKRGRNGKRKGGPLHELQALKYQVQWRSLKGVTL